MASVNYFEPAEIGLGASAPRALAPFEPGPLPERSYFSEGIEAGVEGLKSAGYGAVAAGARGLGLKGVEQAALERSREAAQTAGAMTPRVEDVNSFGDAWDFAKFGLGNALPSIGTTLLGAFGGGGIARLMTRKALRDSTKQFAQTVGATTGGMAASTALEVGSIFPEAVETGVENPGMRALVGGAAAGSLDAFGPLLLARRFGAFGRRAAEAGVVGPGGIRGAAQTAALDALKVGATEVPTEVAQSVIERGAAGKPISDAEAMSEYANVAALTLPTAVLGVPGGAYRGFRGPQEQAQEVPPAAAPEAAPAAVAPPAIIAVTPQGEPVTAPAAEAAPEAPAINPLGATFAGRDQALAERAAIDTRIAELQDKEGWKARQQELSDRLQALLLEKKAPKDQRRPMQEISAEIKQVREAGKQLSAEIKDVPNQVKVLKERQSEADSALALIGDGSFESQAPLQNALAEREALTARLAEIQSTFDTVRGTGGAPGIKAEFAGTSGTELRKLGAERKRVTERLAELNKQLSLVPETATASGAVDPAATDQLYVGDPKLRPLPAFPPGSGERGTSLRELIKRGGTPSAAQQYVRRVSAQEQAARDAETVALEGQANEEAKAAAADRIQKRAEIEAAYQQLDAKQQKQKASELKGLIAAARMDQAAAEIARAEADAAAAEAPEQAVDGPIQKALLDAGKAPADPMINDALAYVRKAGRADAAQMAKALKITRARADALVAKMADWQYVGEPDEKGVRKITKPAEADKPALPADMTARQREFEVWRKLKSGEDLASITDDELARAAQRGPASVRPAVLKELSFRLETEQAGLGRDGDAGTVRSNQEVADQAGQVDQTGQVDRGGDVQQTSQAVGETDDAVLREQDERLRRQIQKLTPKNDPLIKWIIERGGIDAKYAEDITGEKGFNANKFVPGLFKKPKFAKNGQQSAGWGLDEIAIAASTDGEGFLTWDENTDTGGVKALTAAIQKAIGRERRNVRFGDEQEEFNALQSAKDWSDAQSEAQKLGVDLTDATTLEQAWDMIDAAAQIKAMSEGPLSAQFAADEALVARAVEIDEAAVERASIMFEDDTDAFMAEIQGIIDEAEAQAVAQGSETAQQAEAPSPGSPSQGSGGAQEQAAGDAGKVAEQGVEYAGVEQRASKLPPNYGQPDLFTDPEPQTPQQAIQRMTAPAPQLAPPQVKTATIVEPVTTGELRIGVEVVRSAGDAAHVVASLRKSAQERLVILALDKDQRPIAVFRVSHGGVSEAGGYPDVIAGSVYQTPGVASIWMAHNHPSGMAEASAADIRLTRSISRLFGDGTGIALDGHVILSGDKWRALSASGAQTRQAEKIPAYARKLSVPVRERVFRKAGNLDSTEIDRTDKGVLAAQKHLGGKSGVLALDIRNRVIAVIEMSKEQMAKLRTGPDGNLAHLFSGLGRANAVRALVVMKDTDPASVAAIRNVSRAMLVGGVTTVDVVQDGKSWTERDDKTWTHGIGDSFYSISALDIADNDLSTRAEIGKEIASVIDRMIGGQTDVEVRTFMQRDPEGFVGRYRATPYKDVIEIALNAEAPLSVAAHEGFHYVESRLLSKQEREVLNRGLRRGSALYKRVKDVATQYDASRGTDISTAIDAHPMEAHAYAYQFWTEGQLAPTSAIEKVFQKLRNVFEKIRNWIDGYGFTSVEELFDAVNRGLYAKQGRAFMVDANELYDSLDKDLLSRSSTVQTPEFKKWFEGSKVVDAEGKPLVVYHATASDFDVFKPGGGDPDLSGPAIWMTPNKQSQPAAHNIRVVPGQKNRVYTKPNTFTPGTNVMPLYVSIERPLVIDSTTREWAKEVFGKMLPTVMDASEVAEIKAAGYDGILSYDKDSGELDEVVAFSPNQIKSAIGNRGTFDPASESILHSHAAVMRGGVADMLRAAQNGEASYSQLMSVIEKQLHDAPEPTAREILGESVRQRANSLKRFYMNTMSSGHNIARYSEGFRNVFDVLTRYTQRKNRLISDNLEVGLSSWLPWARTEKGVKVTTEDIAAASQALMRRTVGSMRVDSAEYQQLVGSLSDTQRELFDQAGKMVEKMLMAEFEAEKPGFADAFKDNPAAYKQWETNRLQQIEKLIAEGYIPERRYGDHAAHVYTTITDAKGQEKKVTLYYSLSEDEADARLEVKAMGKELKDFPDIKVEYGFRYKPEFDASLSYQQFIEMARANGITLEQKERERIAKSLIAADSTRRMRIFQRKNIPGYSADGTRVLAEFVVNVSNKVAAAEFGNAVKEALRGRPVSTTVQDGVPQIAIDDKAPSVWDKDGEMAGYYNGLAQRTVDFAMGPGENAPASRIMRAAAGFNFLGGSAATALVQLSSLPMNVVPNLMQHTNPADAISTMYGAARKAFQHGKVLRDLTALRSNVELAGIDSDLRTALTRAGEDGTTLDTELYQLMGLTRGALAAKSRIKQKAVDIWMYPFRWSEQMNRISTFIAGWETGKKKGLAGEDLYGFAQKLVYDTQFRYDEANRPAITRNPTWAILFTFKSYPIYMMEMITALAKEKPQAAVALLTGVAIAAGVNGLPFAEDLMDIVDTIAQRLFNQPFNSKRAIRNWLKNASEAIAGADYSGLIMNGVINEMTSLNFASRVGLGNLIPGTRLLAKDTDSADQLQELTGPVGSMVSGWVKGAGELASLDPYAAAREGAPAGIKNLLKSGEQFTHGYAMDAKGQKIVDVSGWEAFAQALGFSSRSLGLAYDLDRMDKQGAAFYKQMRQEMVGKIVSAIRSGDQEEINDASALIGAWNAAHPEMPIAPDVSSLRRAIVQAQLPLNQRTLQMLPKNLRAQSISAEGLE